MTPREPLSHCDQVEVLTRIDNNVRWIRNVGVAVISIVFSAMTFLYAQNDLVTSALAEVKQEASIVSERLTNHLERTHPNAR